MNPSEPNPQLTSEIVTLIVDAVNLHHVPRASITPQTSLRAGGLELDSVDLLEVVVSIEQKYGVKVKDAEAGKTHFQTIGTIAQFVQESRTATA